LVPECHQVGLGVIMNEEGDQYIDLDIT
jgi:hypothetical protein